MKSDPNWRFSGFSDFRGCVCRAYGRYRGVARCHLHGWDLIHDKKLKTTKNPKIYFSLNFLWFSGFWNFSIFARKNWNFSFHGAAGFWRFLENVMLDFEMVKSVVKYGTSSPRFHRENAKIDKWISSQENPGLLRGKHRLNKTKSKEIHIFEKCH